MITVIGDIHGEAALLERLLHEVPNEDELIFVGDLIDRGTDNRGVVERVRSLVESGRARCLMGNHEFNAVLYHTTGADGAPLRPHTPGTFRQHEAFLRDYPVGAAHTRDVITWFETLPIFIDRHGLRVVHAQWDVGAIRVVRETGTQDGRGVWSLPRGWVHLQQVDPAFRDAVLVLTKGTEFPLPDGGTFTDKSGNARTDVRLAWWNADGADRLADQIAGPSERRERWRDHPPADLPEVAYPADAPTVVFGHYGLDSDVVYQAPNVVCVDHTRRAGGPLTAWRSDGTVMQVR